MERRTRTISGAAFARNQGTAKDKCWKLNGKPPSREWGNVEGSKGLKHTCQSSPKLRKIQQQAGTPSLSFCINASHRVYNDSWIIDSGATDHMTSKSQLSIPIPQAQEQGTGRRIGLAKERAVFTTLNHLRKLVIICHYLFSVSQIKISIWLYHLRLGHHSFRPNLSGHISIRSSLSLSLSLSRIHHQSLFSEPREKTLSGQSNRRQKTLTAGNFSGELFRRTFRRLFFYTARSAWRRSPICPKAPEPETHPRAAHARFSGRRLHLTRRRVRAREPLSGDALPPPGSPDADQPPFLPVCAIRALHVPLLGFFCFRGPSDQIFRRPPAIFSQLQSLHVP
ncbi:hypothetical protein CK203_043077 [Vitis vinifera]|uniref:Uncharacterized protein n=1 Tax=Vitis vinifera TaxID=29760 RepID=A0A438GXA8_VITVI|nr:hypothetical protein CK203_043077 [Vitis vinifera]